MLPVKFSMANWNHQYADGVELSAHLGGDVLTTCWQPNKEDIEAMVLGKPIWLHMKIPPGTRMFPFHLTLGDPFRVPRSLIMNDEIVDKVAVWFWDDIEVVLLQVRPKEKNFEVEKLSGEEGEGWMITIEHEGLEGRFLTEYIFFEELKVIGLASKQYGIYDKLCALLRVDPLHTLILKRVNETK